MTSGFLLINKPIGPTSHDVVDMVRRATGIRTVGHAGTLDPFASGLLIVGVGREATRQLDQFKNLPKTYIATIRLGARSDTDDRTGQIEESRIKNLELSSEKIEKLIQSFIGEVEQTPPMYSAKKIKGQKLYEIARQGRTVERKPANVTIHSIELLDISDTEKLKNCPTIKLKINCSSGTYIRALARDIGEELQCGAYCEELTRTAIGPYTLSEATTLEQLTPLTWQQYLQPIADCKLQIAESEKLKIIVLVFGTFDLLHPGHLDFFRQAKALGDYLIAGVGRDQVVAALKGKLPRQKEHERLAAVQECSLVDEAYLLPDNPEERFQWIKKINPAVIALGYDQTAFTDHLAQDLARHGIDCRIVRLKPYHPDRYKSSKM
ncbi:tRNA pseudouridine(55) synthase TruB [Candidatus Uhrbacteria bacterium RIFCSPLOWO2_02_FULL_49_11]|uniref:tRNA pseudouridine synthase B n=1 Tax=Candidatus Uhrbacteria bacterium RIFCSPLOWO2_02_FULL_49_11 TaxID=1802409 RepID=A0A1F7VBQ2_9BACT|nr:MAG: tRNA pseudouridine(55) synthase TruB [Candidatus Uhrbacteria bacterium RIFCSPLOWO2_02_FULL_49_11]